MGWPGGAIEAAWEGLKHVLLPDACVLCGETEPSELPGLCPDCVERLPPLPATRCPTCALPFDGVGPSHGCTLCLKHPPPFDAVHARGVYGGTLQELIGAFKYRNNLAARRTLETLVGQAYLPLHAEKPHANAVVPVPCHSRTLSHRGFDLPALLARSLSRRWGLEWRPRALEKRNGDVRMATLGLTKRRAAIRGLYRPREALAGRVILVDDVVTSTATVRACAKACLRAGAEQVRVVTLARTPSDPKDK